MHTGEQPFVLFGITQSWLTRKMSGCLDHKGLPWRLKHFGGDNPEMRAAGSKDGIPTTETPEGEIM